MTPHRSPAPSSRRRWLAATGALLAVGAAISLTARAVGAEAKLVPAFAGAEPGPATPTETAVFAGGCFWGVQAVFQHVKGVSSAVSGYAGGEAAGATYAAVGSGATGHAEAVQLRYDPRQVSYARLLQIYFSVAHDPTQRNRQGPDVGTQYRSAVFPQDEAQARIARAYIAQLDQSHSFRSAIATTVEPGRAFFAAEAYHQDFLARNPRHPYIVFNDLPKLDDLKRLFPAEWRAEPVLVGRVAS